MVAMENIILKFPYQRALICKILLQYHTNKLQLNDSFLGFV